MPKARVDERIGVSSKGGDPGYGEGARPANCPAERVGGFQGFASIRRNNGAFVVLLADHQSGETQPLETGGTSLEGADSHAKVHLNHVYLICFTEDPDFERVAKLLVVAHDPGVSATVRWVLLD